MTTQHTTTSAADTTAARNTATIPGAFYDLMFERGLELPLEEEIRRVGKGKQYEVHRDTLFDGLVAEADKYLSAEHHGTKVQTAAIAMLRSLRTQGIPLKLTNSIPAQTTRRIVWIKTECVLPHSFGKYAGRRLILGIDKVNGNIIHRVHGTRQSEVINAADSYRLGINGRALRARLEKARAKKAAKAERRKLRAA